MSVVRAVVDLLVSVKVNKIFDDNNNLLISTSTFVVVVVISHILLHVVVYKSKVKLNIDILALYFINVLCNKPSNPIVVVLFQPVTLAFLYLD